MCVRCGGKGAVRLNYRSGEPFDVAICWCQTGEQYRRMEASGEGVLASQFAGADRVVWLEDAAEPEDFQRWGCEPPSSAPSEIIADALRGFGRMQKAGLGGQKGTA